MYFPVCVVRFVLKLSDNVAELFVSQHTLPFAEAFIVKKLHQTVFAVERCSIQSVTVSKIIQDFQVRNLLKQARIFMRIEHDIMNKLLVDRAKTALHNTCLLDRINVDFQFCNRQFSQMQPIYNQSFVLQVKIFDPDPVLGDFAVFVSVFDTQPFAFMDCPKDFLTYTVHGDITLL